jgi:ribosomal protein S18 acetylase RimI-like enzyme
VTDGLLVRILRYMDGHNANPLTFGPARQAELPEVFQLLFGRLDETFRALQTAAALEEIEKNGGEGQIVLAARRGQALAAAIWVQILPGRVASLWPPGLAAGETAATASTIIDLAMAKAAVAGVRLVQVLLETDAKAEAAWLRQCGFGHITDLLYLVSLQKVFPITRPSSKLIFEPLGKVGESDTSEIQMARLAAVIGRTYVNTQDCPAIQGLRSVDDVLATYRAVGMFNPARWFFVRNDNADIGCLLLADHSQERNCELVYMGIVPEARGHGWGVDIVRQAQWLSGQSRDGGQSGGPKHGQNGGQTAQRLVLAVDAANFPAFAMYTAAGFETWDRRSVFLREIAEDI